jgi:hypothetical protein
MKDEMQWIVTGSDGYTVRIMRKGSNVQTTGGNEKGQGAFEDPDSALDDASDSQLSQGSLNDRDIG